MSGGKEPNIRPKTRSLQADGSLIKQELAAQELKQQELAAQELKQQETLSRVQSRISEVTEDIGDARRSLEARQDAVRLSRRAFRGASRPALLILQGECPPSLLILQGNTLLPF